MPGYTPSAGHMTVNQTGKNTAPVPHNHLERVSQVEGAVCAEAGGESLEYPPCRLQADVGERMEVRGVRDDHGDIRPPIQARR